MPPPPPPSEERIETRLASPPLDTVSCVRFAPASDQLAVSSWDQSVRVYAVDAASSTPKFQTSRPAPVLDICWASDRDVLFGGMDAAVVLSRIEPTWECTLGRHNDDVSAVMFDPTCRTVFSGSWDKTVKRWDPRMASREVDTSKLPAEVISMDCIGHRLVVALGCRHISVYDTRNLRKPEQRRESALGHQTRSVRCFPDGTGFGACSVEGRVAMEWFDLDPEVQRAKKYAFRNLRQIGDEAFHPVNALAFHPRHGTFATGASDGYVHLWNAVTQKRLYQLRRFPASITSLSFNSAGTLLAIAASEVPVPWMKPIQPHQRPENAPPNQVYIRRIVEADIQPKPTTPNSV
nr:Mitotic checkpoint protein BUB3 [Euglena gracilis]